MAGEMNGFVVAGYEGSDPVQGDALVFPVLAGSEEDAIRQVKKNSPGLKVVGCLSETLLRSQLAQIEGLRARG
jgi:hypothetical protein